jgi:hypothetical protein
MQLGDSWSTRFGEAALMGVDPALNGFVKSSLESGLMPPVLESPPARDLAEAAAAYNRADGDYHRCGDDAGRVAVALRAAYVSALGGAPDAADRYRAAALRAEAAGDGRTAMLAGAARFVLTGDASSLDTLVTNRLAHGDVGAVLGIARLIYVKAAEEAFRNSNPTRAHALLAPAIDVLNAHQLAQTAGDLMDLDLQLQLQAGRIDDAIASGQQLVALRRQALPYLEQLPQTPLQQRLLLNARLAVADALAQQVGKLGTMAVRDINPRWRERMRAAMSELSPLRAWLLANQTQFPSVDSQLLTVDFRRALLHSRRSPERAQALADVRRRALDLHDDVHTTLVDVVAKESDARLAPRVRADLERLAPVARLSAALKELPPPLPFGRALGLVAVIGELDFTLALAVRSRNFDLLARWLIELQPFIAGRPELVALRTQVAYYEARLQQAKGQLGDARAAYERLLTSPLDDSTRIAVERQLIEVTAALGDAWTSLLWRERVRLHLTRSQALRAGAIAGSTAAERSALLRTVALGQALTSAQQARLAQLEHADATAYPEQRLVDVEALRQQLAHWPSRSVMLAYHVGADHVLAYRFDGKLTVRVARGNADDILDDAAAVWSLLAVRDGGWRQPARRLHDALLAPMAVTRGARLLILPSDYLQRVPFEVLSGPSGKLLVEQHEIAYSSAVLSAPAPAFSAKAVIVTGLNSNGLTRAEAEATTVAARLGVAPLVGDAATLSAISTALPGADLVHIVTHGIVDVDNPFLSHLMLAHGDRLEAWQLFRYLRSPGLVVLSACEMGGSANPDRALENASIADVAHAAGARRVISALWSVDDDRTADLMTDLYDGRDDGLDVALARAKRKRLRLHPFFWAPFVLSFRDVGEWMRGSTQ